MNNWILNTTNLYKLNILEVFFSLSCSMDIRWARTGCKGSRQSHSSARREVPGCSPWHSAKNERRLPPPPIERKLHQQHAAAAAQFFLSLSANFAHVIAHDRSVPGALRANIGLRGYFYCFLMLIMTGLEHGKKNTLHRSRFYALDAKQHRRERARAIIMEMRCEIKRAAVKFSAEKWQRAWACESKDLIKRDIIYSVAFTAGEKCS